MDLRIEKMDQPSAQEIADRWKYDGDYAFYDMTADPEAVRLSVASFNRRAVKVYERAGFVETGTARVSTNGGAYEFTMMERRRGA